jgi:uncharacterized protein (TIGR03000 family)
MRLESTVAVALVSLFAGTADAQIFGRSTSGFNGNGMSGPFVPSYGIVPGGFAGPSYSTSQSAPHFGTSSVGLFGRRSRTPAIVDQATPNSGETEEPPLADDKVSGLHNKLQTGVLALEVRLPVDNAVVYVNDQPTKQNGTVRKFASPVLPLGDTYEYDVRAEWVANGKRVIQTKTLNGKPGERLVADFAQ